MTELEEAQVRMATLVEMHEWCQHNALGVADVKGHLTYAKRRARARIDRLKRQEQRRDAAVQHP